AGAAAMASAANAAARRNAIIKSKLPEIEPACIAENGSVGTTSMQQRIRSMTQPCVETASLQ
ncbi:MAG: hypothetical protein WD928_01245, partial [Gammaproteobacteria bacterium]